MTTVEFSRVNTLQLSRRLTDLAGERDEFTCKKKLGRCSLFCPYLQWRRKEDINVFWQPIHSDNQESGTKKRPPFIKLQPNLSPEIPVTGYLIIVHMHVDTITCMQVHFTKTRHLKNDSVLHKENVWTHYPLQYCCLLVTEVVYQYLWNEDNGGLQCWWLAW